MTQTDHERQNVKQKKKEGIETKEPSRNEKRNPQ